jgi:hypothetical protein
MSGHKGPTLLAQLLMGEMGGELVGHLAGMSGGWGMMAKAAGLIGSTIYGAQRAVGMTTVRDLVANGVLQPELGRILLQHAITDAQAPLLTRLKQRMIALLATSGAAANQNEHRRR